MPKPLIAMGIMLATVPAAARAADGAAGARFDEAVAATKAAMMTAPADALRHARAAEIAASQMPHGASAEMAAAAAHWLRGEATTRVGQPQAALPLLNEGLATVVKHAPADKLHGDILLSRGWIEASLGQVQPALEDFQMAHNILRAAGDARGQAKALQNIGGIYHDAGDNERSLRYYGQAAELAGQDAVIGLAAHNNVGETLKALGRYRAAGAEYGLALAAARQLQSPAIEVHILTNLASAQLMAGAPRLAEATALRSLALGKKIGASDERPFALGVLAQAAMEKGEVDRAALLIGQTFAGQDLARTPLPFRDFHATAAEIFAREGRHDLAYAHLAAFKRLDDGARVLAASTNSALMAAKFDFANQDLKIARLSAGQLRLRTVILSVALGAAGVIFLLLLAGFLSLRRSRNEVRAANTQLSNTNVSLEKALKAKTEFLATTSHEIRTPLNGILGTTQVVLADQRLDGWLRDKVELVHSAGETMRALVDDILDVAKIETGKLTLREETFALDRLLHDAARFWGGPAEAKRLEKRTMLADCPGAIHGDEARLRQIVFNLMSNAVKFTSEGWVSLDVSTAPTADGERLLIRVADSGIGIPADEHEAIFEKFYQVDGGTTRQFSGTGLGLAICRSLADAMGGSISVESRVGEGSEFTLDLPLRLADAIPVPVAGEGAILLVEPNPLTQRILAKTLKRLAGTIDAVATLDEADQLLVTRSYACAVVQLDACRDAAPFLAHAQRAACPTVALYTPNPLTAEQLTGRGWTLAIAKPCAPAEVAASLDQFRSPLQADSRQTDAA